MGMGGVGLARYEPALPPPRPTVRAFYKATVTVRDPSIPPQSECSEI